MEARCPRGPGAATTVTPQGARTPTGLSKGELKWQLAEIDPAKETLLSGLRGGGRGRETPRTAILKDKNPMLQNSKHNTGTWWNNTCTDKVYHWMRTAPGP